jgi:hypothetical protein
LRKKRKPIFLERKRDRELKKERKRISIEKVHLLLTFVSSQLQEHHHVIRRRDQSQQGKNTTTPASYLVHFIID